jgi:hypothetical protein
MNNKTGERSRKMIRPLAIIAVLLLCLSPTKVSSQTPSFQQTYQSCAYNAEGIFSAIKDYQLNVPLEKAEKNNPKNTSRVYKMVKEKGLKYVYVGGHVHYMRCSKTVSKITPLSSLTKGTINWAYAGCAMNSGRRFSVIDGILKRVSRGKMKERFSRFPRMIKLIDTLYDISENSSIEKTLALSADIHEGCIKKIVKAER